MTDRKRIDLNLVATTAAALLQRERALLLPVAFATLWLGQLVNDRATLNMLGLGSQTDVLVTGLLSAVLAAIGEGALIVLTLQPGLSVREALAIGVRRAPAIIGALLLILLIALVLALPILPVLGHGLAQARAGNSVALWAGWTPGLSVYALCAFLIFGWIALRLTLFRPVIVMEKANPLVALKRSFRLTAAVQWRLLASLVGCMLMIIIGLGAILLPLSLVLKMMGMGPTETLAGALVLTLVRSVVLTVLALAFSVFFACLYRTVSQTAPH